MARSPYGYAMDYRPHKPPKKKTPPKPKQPAWGAPAPPNTSALWAQIKAMAPKDRSEAEWSEVLDPRVQPFIDAINKSTGTARAQSEFQFERSSAAQSGLAQAFVKMLTGGKTGDEAMAHSKENFGGSYLSAQAMEMGMQAVRELTSEWDEREWAISGEYQKAMQEIPAIREQLRAGIEAKDMSEYERKFTTATLLIDELWQGWTARNAQFEFGVGAKQTDRSISVQQGQLMLANAETKQDEAQAMTTFTGRLHVVKNGKVVDTGQVAPGTTAYANVQEGILAEGAAAGKAKETRAGAVTDREDAFKVAKTNMVGTAKGYVTIPDKSDLPIEAQFSIDDGSKTLEDYATRTDYVEASANLWTLYGDDLLRYASKAGKASLRKRIQAEIDAALAQVGIRPKPKKRPDVGKPRGG